MSFADFIGEMFKPEYRRDNWHDIVPSLSGWTYEDKFHGVDTGAPKRYVYFIRWGEFIKIGCSGNPEERLHQISYRKKKEGPSITDGNPYLIAYVPGAFKEEKQQHMRWHHLHDQGEWFRAEEEELIVFAEEIRIKQAEIEVEIHEIRRKAFCEEHDLELTEVDLKDSLERHLKRKIIPA